MEEREMIRRWVQTWREAGPVRDAICARESGEADNLKVLASLEGAFNQALRAMPPRSSSGLVEMQKLLAKLRRCSICSRPQAKCRRSAINKAGARASSAASRSKDGASPA